MGEQIGKNEVQLSRSREDEEIVEKKNSSCFSYLLGYFIECLLCF